MVVFVDQNGQKYYYHFCAIVTFSMLATSSIFDLFLNQNDQKQVL